MRTRFAVLLVLLLAAGGLVFFLGGAPQTADGSTTAGATAEHGEREARHGAGADGATDAGVDPVTGRRLTGLAEGLVDLVSRPTRAPTPEQARAGARLIELFNDFDLDAAGQLYKNPSVGTEEWFQWLRARVGACGGGEPMVVQGARVRYLYACEHGQLEAEFELDPDTGKIPRLIMGARDVDLAEPVREAAAAVMRLYDAWDPELFRRTFNDKFELEEIRRFLLDVRLEHGDCSLGEPDLVSARGALIRLDCERSPRLMKVELQQDDDRIRTLWIRAPRPGR